ncbi:MAG: creatininase family protein [Myxococcaceae bacterium]
MPSLYARELSWPAVKRLAEANAVALLPVGSTEAHGPHLPLSVDVVIAEEVARRTAKRLYARGERAIIFPAISYSLTDFANGFAGTVSVSAQVNEAYLVDVLVGIARHGFRRIGVLNHHVEPAHFSLVHAAAKAAAQKCGAGIVVPDHRKKPISPRLGEEFVTGGSHAGRYETSLVLAAAKELVDESVRASLPDFDINLPAAIKGGARTFEECGGHEAYFGSPKNATVEEGDRLYEVLADVSEAAVLALP